MNKNGVCQLKKLTSGEPQDYVSLKDYLLPIKMYCFTETYCIYATEIVFFLNLISKDVNIKTFLVNGCYTENFAFIIP